MPKTYLFLGGPVHGEMRCVPDENTCLVCPPPETVMDRRGMTAAIVQRYPMLYYRRELEFRGDIHKVFVVRGWGAYDVERAFVELKARQCCELDTDFDGNCERHRTGPSAYQEFLYRTGRPTDERVESREMVDEWATDQIVWDQMVLDPSRLDPGIRVVRNPAMGGDALFQPPRSGCSPLNAMRDSFDRGMSPDQEARIRAAMKTRAANVIRQKLSGKRTPAEIEEFVRKLGFE